MARFRLSRQAQADLANVLAASAGRWGIEGRRRYAAMLTTAMREVATSPEGPATRDRAEALPGVRSFHVRHARSDDSKTRARRPGHVIYYRVVQPGLLEIVRVLHDRMEPSRHLGAVAEEGN